jgi:uncharacterized protein (TIGR00369 family)
MYGHGQLEEEIMDKQRSSRTCFLCGRQNPIGLKMEWYSDPEAKQVRATVTVPQHFNSYPGVVHGGIVAALLDETSGRSLLLDGDTDSNLMVTLKLEVKYRRPVPTDQRLTLRGWIIQRTPTRAKVAAELLLPDGSLAAEAQAVVVRPPQEFFARWEPEKQYWRVYDE